MALLSGIQRNGKMTELDLGGHRFLAKRPENYGELTSAIASAISSNASTLSSINMSHILWFQDDAYPDDITPLASALESCRTTLRDIDLSFCHLYSKRLIALANSLRNCPSLHSLNIATNCLTFSCLANVCTVVASCPELRTLNVSYIWDPKETLTSHWLKQFYTSLLPHSSLNLLVLAGLPFVLCESFAALTKRMDVDYGHRSQYMQSQNKSLEDAGALVVVPSKSSLSEPEVMPREVLARIGFFSLSNLRKQGLEICSTPF
eukprot:CAMPEP_0184671638 /NCGR_PEP_ID=MMETSP0308-20130426/85528_1 /TAXON_ID=38269 /ORGANISM="Gloeochaete witrockiana, Strain SAG 46.84" /LENGTH=262 /DNA_ID=CAMNT_0027118809 /DNA_START=692 /DNA_END=1480 /DNA_ORIENTATION=+